MVFGLDFLWTDDALHNAFFVNDEGRAEGTHVFTAIHALLAPYTKLFDQLLVCVGNQGEGEGVLLDEFLVRLFAIYTDAYHFVGGRPARWNLMYCPSGRSRAPVSFLYNCSGGFLRLSR